MMESFKEAFEYTVGHEGGFGKDPEDSGNWDSGKVGTGTLRGTKFGISSAAYPHFDIENLTIEQAEEIYYEDYWKKLHCDEFEPTIAKELFDTGVNMGTSRAGKFMQRALNVLNRNEKDYENIDKDGSIGGQTVGAYRKVRNISLLHKVLNILQGAYYIELMERKEFMEKYQGWFNRVEFKT